MSAMLNLLPKILQNILTQNCFYYNILQLLFPFWHVFFCIFRHFSCQRNLFTVSLANVLCFNTMPYFAGIDRHVPHTTQHGFGTVQSRHVKKNNVLEKLQKTSSSRRQNVRQNLRKTPDRLQKIARWQHCTKKCKKSKKHHTKLLSSEPVLRKMQKNENILNLQGKIYLKMQKMRISPHFLQLIANDFVLFFFVCKRSILPFAEFLKPKLCPTCVVPSRTFSPQRTSSCDVSTTVQGQLRPPQLPRQAPSNRAMPMR